MFRLLRVKDAVAILMLLVLGLAHYVLIPAPPAIKVAPYTQSQIEKEVELEHKEKAIKKAIAAARMVYRKNGCRDVYSEITGRTAYEYGLSARLLASVVFVESSCRAKAISGRSSVGLMQINPKVWKHTRAELMNPELNMRIGAKILKAYIARYGLVEGLHAYNGFGNPTNEYATHVLSVAKISPGGQHG